MLARSVTLLRSRYPRFDKLAHLHQSVCCHLLREDSFLKKALLILALVVLALVFILNIRVHAASEWQTLGQTQAGDTVSISSVRLLPKNQRVALIRVDYKQPPMVPSGGPFLEMRARVHFNCSAGTAVPTTEWFYTRDRSGRFVVIRKVTRDAAFGQAAEGGFASLISAGVCAQNK
jgi:hypothetical protein